MKAHHATRLPGIATRRMRGLIEVAIGFAAWSLLVALAASFYRVYIERAHVVEALVLATTIRQEIVAEYSSLGRWPAEVSQRAPSAESPHRAVGAIDYDGSGFTIHLSRPTAVYAVSFRPAVNRASGTPIIWLCGYAAAPPGYESAAPNRSDIPPQYLPGTCRKPA